jgi:hypothetical protein
MPLPAAASLFAVLLAVAALLGCGEEDAQLLPGSTAREITANLDTVQRLADEGDCIGAESAARQVSEQVEALNGVDERLRRALRDGAARLNEVVADCEEEEAVAPDTAPTETESTTSDEENRKASEKAEEKAEKKEEKEEERKGDGETTEAEKNPSLPPQAEGEGKGLDDGSGSGPSDGEEGGGTPAGGVSPGNPAGGESD